MWQPTLYKRSKNPDNYSDGFLTNLQTNLNIVHYSFWDALLAASKLMCQIDVIVAYFCVFEFVQINALNFGHLALLILLLLTVFEAIFLVYNAKYLKSQTALYDHLQTALTFLLFGFGFTPIIRTLTTTISTDTIYALSILSFGFSLVFHDYGATVWIINTPLSVNLCLAASVFLISRMENDLDAFFMLSLAVCLFSFWPRIRNHLFLRCKCLPLIFIIILGTACSFALLFIMRELVGLLAILHLIIVILCPYYHTHIQSEKRTLHGCWSEAVFKKIT